MSARHLGEPSSKDGRVVAPSYPGRFRSFDRSGGHELANPSDSPTAFGAVTRVVRVAWSEAFRIICSKKVTWGREKTLRPQGATKEEIMRSHKLIDVLGIPVLVGKAAAPGRLEGPPR